jgi:hypothetical protein
VRAPVHNYGKENPIMRKATPTRKATAMPADESMHEQIARRAYEISQSEQAQSDEENWLEAERELQATSEAAGP